MTVQDVVERAYRAVHVAVYRGSGGWLGTRLRGPVILLTTVGRKSGQQRTTPLIAMRDGERLVVVASNGGRDVHPNWWLNLQRNSEAGVRLGRERLSVRASEATGEERARLWALLVKQNKGWAGYQERTKRVIPVVVLTPV
jgi:deazaflavin-dependent oxidoreductase (nitroreductase family)